jgi:nicotinamide-nucleotide amidase
MKAAIITIGDEILIGQIIDTNSSYIAKALDKIGIATHEMLSISDDKNHILKTLHDVQNKFDVVLITGGLGPTKDDITKKTFCDYFDDVLVQNDAVLVQVKSIIEGIYKKPKYHQNQKYFSIHLVQLLEC